MIMMNYSSVIVAHCYSLIRVYHCITRKRALFALLSMVAIELPGSQVQCLFIHALVHLLQSDAESYNAIHLAVVGADKKMVGMTSVFFIEKGRSICPFFEYLM